MQNTMSRRRTILVTFGIMMGLFLASIEGTVVGTAMPTIIAQLQGIELYGWVFSMYMLTSTSTMPVFGKLSDMYGRRPIYMIAVAMFLLGSMLCGTAQSMTQLIAFRALQGLGAGGLLPLAFTLIGDLFTMEQRAKMQGLFSGVWGVSGLLGPLAGGWLVDNVSWRAVFYVNVPFALLTAAIIWFGLQEAPVQSVRRRAIDYLGVILLMSGIMSLLLALLEGPDQGWSAPLVLALFSASLLLLGTFVWHEMRTPEPIISPALFQQRLFSIASLHGFLTGMAMFGSISFIPLFGQGVLALDATAAGAMLIPTNIGWVASSTIGGRLLLKFGYRKIVIACMSIMVLGSFLMSRIHGGTTEWQVWVFGVLMGIGMGGSVTAFLISVQSSVTRQQLGAATSTIQFMRNVGGTIGVSIFGTVMVSNLIEGLARQGGSANIDPRAVLDPTSSIPPAVLASMRGVLADAIGSIFTLAFVAVAAAFVIVLLSPRGLTRDSTVPSEAKPEVLAEVQAR